MAQKMDLNAVRIFVIVVDKASFVAAARSLQLPTSNISRYVAQLEKQLNVRLLERSTRNMRLTDAGKLLYQHAKPLLDALELAESELVTQQTDLRGLLKLSIPSEFGPELLEPIMASFARQYPNIEISCNTSLSGAEVLLDDIDVAIIFNRGHIDDGNLIAKTIATFPSTVVAAPSLIEQMGLPQQIKNLKDYPCITTLSALKGQPWQFIDKKGKREKVMVKSRYKVNSGRLAWEAALQGIGLAILAEYACQDDIAQGRLIRVPLDAEPEPLQLLAIYPSRHYVPARVLVFLAWLQQQLAEINPVVQ